MEINEIISNLLKLDRQIDISLYFSDNEEQDLLLYYTIDLIERQARIIDLMAVAINTGKEIPCLNKSCEDNGEITCVDCIKEYFENKVEEERNG